MDTPLENTGATEIDTAASAVNAPEPADVEVKSPNFSPLVDEGKIASHPSIKRFYDVQVTVSAELGRVTIPIGNLVELGEGSVIELNRSVTSPIDLMAQGVRVATGEVVVVDDCFAIRIKSIEDETPPE